MSHELERLLDLQPVGDDSFVGAEAPERGGRMFGGQLLAQALVAAGRTAGDDREPHSLHGYFLRAGEVDDTVTLLVERIRDGRSFSSRQVAVTQGGKEIFRAIASFHVPEDGLSYDAGAMPEAPPPESVSMTYDDFTRQEGPDEEWFGAARPIDIRYINPPNQPRGVPVTESQKMWIRIPPTLRDEPLLHAAGLAYLSDATLVDHCLLPHGRRWQDPELTGASLDHAMWFHRPAAADSWMLYDQRVEYTGGARGLATAALYSADGATIATCAQEGLMRVPRS